jgi:hypothetical protein
VAMSTCPECGARYSPRSGGHCRGGAYGGCCQSFAGDAVAGSHRVGPYDPPDARRCLTPQEMQAKGWHLGKRGWSMSAPMPEGLWAE